LLYSSAGRLKIFLPAGDFKTIKIQQGIRTVQLSITQMIMHAGPVGQMVMLLLLVFSLVSWAIIFMKARLFRNVRLDSEDFLETFWSSSTLKEAGQAAEEFAFSPEAAVFTAGFSELQKINKIRNRSEESGKETLEMQLATMDNLKRALRKAENEEINKLGSLLPFLATTGSAAPFIGLFGTVWGIMVSFHDIGQRGSASLAVVAPGISEALVATAAGLAAAIPAVIFYNYFSNKLTDVQYNVQSFSTDFLNLVERDLLSRV
jgi:biopolymer transport protein TolQ